MCLFFCYGLGRLQPLNGDLYRMPVYWASCCSPLPARLCRVVPEVLHKVIHKICGVQAGAGQKRESDRAAWSNGRAWPHPARRAGVGLASPVQGCGPEVIHKMNSRESAPGGASRLDWRPSAPELGRRGAGPAAKGPDKALLVLKAGPLRHLLDRT